MRRRENHFIGKPINISNNMKNYYQTLFVQCNNKNTTKLSMSLQFGQDINSNRDTHFLILFIYLRLMTYLHKLFCVRAQKQNILLPTIFLDKWIKLQEKELESVKYNNLVKFLIINFWWAFCYRKRYRYKKKKNIIDECFN